MSTDPMNDPAFQNYARVLEKVEAFWQQVESQFPLHCAKGCSACCHVDLSVMPVEADHIRAYLQSAAPPVRHASEPAPHGALDDHPRFQALAGPNPCAFLNRDGLCAIYAARPLICRSHGIPIKVDEKVDACPLNEGVEAAPLNLSVLNTLLVAVNARYAEVKGLPPAQAQARIPLRELAAEALARQAASTDLPTEESV